MLMSVLGTTAAALERCTEIEEELHQSQVGVLACPSRCRRFFRVRPERARALAEEVARHQRELFAFFLYRFTAPVGHQC